MATYSLKSLQSLVGFVWGKGETGFTLVISLYLFAQLELCFPWWFGHSCFCLLPKTKSFLPLSWSLLCHGFPSGFPV